MRKHIGKALQKGARFDKIGRDQHSREILSVRQLLDQVEDDALRLVIQDLIFLILLLATHLQRQHEISATETHVMSSMDTGHDADRHQLEDDARQSGTSRHIKQLWTLDSTVNG